MNDYIPEIDKPFDVEEEMVLDKIYCDWGLIKEIVVPLSAYGSKQFNDYPASIEEPFDVEKEMIMDSVYCDSRYTEKENERKLLPSAADRQ